MTISCLKELDYIDKDPQKTQNLGRMDETQPPKTSVDTVREVMEILHNKLPPMPKNLAVMSHHNFYPKLKVDLNDADISPETGQKWLILQRNYNDIISKHSSDMGLNHLEEMKIDTDPNLPPVARKPYPLTLKHHKFVKEELNIY